MPEHTQQHIMCRIFMGGVCWGSLLSSSVSLRDSMIQTGEKSCSGSPRPPPAGVRNVLSLPLLFSPLTPSPPSHLPTESFGVLVY